MTFNADYNFKESIRVVKVRVVKVVKVFQKVCAKVGL